MTYLATGLAPLLLSLTLFPCAASAQEARAFTFEGDTTEGWAASSPQTVQVSVRPEAGPTGGALHAETDADRLYVGHTWRFTEADSCLSFDFRSGGPAAPYFVQMGVRTADGAEYWTMPAVRPPVGQWMHARVPLTRSFSQALRGAEIVRVWIGQVRAEGADGRRHALLIDNVQLTHGVPPVTDRDLFVTATRLPEAPTVDGRLDDEAWRHAAPVSTFVTPDGAPASRPVEVRIGYDDVTLYVAMDSRDDPGALVARETTPDGPVWADDSFEVFLDPDRDRATYFQLATNPLGTPFSLRGSREKDGRVTLDTTWDPHWQVAVGRGEQGWSAEFAIPFADLGAQPGGAWGLQIGRHRPRGETCSLFLRERDWCDPAEWGLLVFGERPPGLRVHSVADRILTGEVTGLGAGEAARILCEALSRTDEATRTEATVSGPELSVPYRVAESGKQRLAVTLLDAQDRPACRVLYPLPDTRDVQVLRPRTLASSDALVLWTLGPTWKVLPGDRVEAGPPEPVVEMQCGRNQVRALQIGVTPRRPPLRGLRLEFGDLASQLGTLHASSLRYDTVGYVTITEPSDTTTFPGDWPDPLLPPEMVDAADARHVVFWVTLRVPRDAPPGLYEAPARLVGEGLSEPFTLRLTVLDYELPDLSRLLVSADVWYGWGVYRTTYGEIQYEEFLRNGLAHRVAGIGRVRPGAREDVPARGEEYYGTGLRFAWFPVPFVGAGGWEGRRKWGEHDIDPDDPAFVTAFTEDTRALAAVFRERGWLDKTAFWVWDEPFWAQDALLREKLPALCRLIREAAPDLPIFLSHPPVQELEGLVDIWCPALHFGAPDLSAGAIRAIHERGEQVWVYHNELALIDLPAINARILPWIVRRLGVDGIIWWSINFWGGTGGVAHLDPWTVGLGPRRYRHGDGWFLYPTATRDGILDSIRWELFREGLTDYDVLLLLQERAAASRHDDDAGDWLGRAERVLAEADAMVTGYRDFVPDPARLEAIIRRAERLLDAAP